MAMEKYNVHHPSSVVIVTSGDKICHAIYDNTFPWEVWRNHANFIGGNYEYGKDYSPRGLLEREVSEEIAVSHKNPESFAPESQILRTRRTILLNAKSYGDFLIRDPKVKQTRADGTIKTNMVNGKVQNNVVSVYHSEIPIDLMNEIIDTLASGKRMTTEGNIGVNPISSLQIGRVPMAWSSPAMLEIFLGRTVKNPKGATAEFIGETRETYLDYLPIFNFTVPIE
jgi:hypothetical protein